MKIDPLAGLGLDELNLKPVTRKPLQQPGQPVQTRPERGHPIRQPEPARPPEPTYQPAPVTVRPPLVQPVANPPAPKRQAGRPRLYADHVLTPTEKARRYRQKRKAVTAGALDGSLLPVELALMGNRDLCLVVARMLNRPSDLDLRQMGLPLVKELQRRLKSL